MIKLVNPVTSALRIIDLYLRSNIDRSLLSRPQHAYIKDKSVESALHDATGFVEENLARGGFHRY